MSVGDSLGFAVIGCGMVSEVQHLPAFREIRQARLVGVVDRDYARARDVAKKFQTCAANDYRELFGRIDAALVATPNSTHAQISSDLLREGIHVLCEKPMATSVSDAEIMFACAKKGRARLMSGQSRRFGRHMQAVKNLIDCGILGKVKRISMSLGGDISKWPARTDYRRRSALSGGGVLLDTGIHLIDLALWMTRGVPTSVSCNLQHINGWDVEDNAEVFMETSTGATVHLACSYNWGLSGTLAIECEKGWAKAVLNDTSSLEIFGPSARICQRSGVQTLAFGQNNPYVRQLAHFCDAVLKQQPFIVSEQEVLEGLRLVRSCYAREMPGSAEKSEQKFV